MRNEGMQPNTKNEGWYENLSVKLRRFPSPSYMDFLALAAFIEVHCSRFDSCVHGFA